MCIMEFFFICVFHFVISLYVSTSPSTSPPFLMCTQHSLAIRCDVFLLVLQLCVMANVLRLEWHLLRAPVDELRLMIASQPTVAQLELSSSFETAMMAEAIRCDDELMSNPSVYEDAATKFETGIPSVADVTAGAAHEDKRLAILDALISNVAAMQHQVRLSVNLSRCCRSQIILLEGKRFLDDHSLKGHWEQLLKWAVSSLMQTFGSRSVCLGLRVCDLTSRHHKYAFNLSVMTSHGYTFAFLHCCVSSCLPSSTVPPPYTPFPPPIRPSNSSPTADE